MRRLKVSVKSRENAAEIGTDAIDNVLIDEI